MSDHLLHLDSVDRWGDTWRLECCHAELDARWQPKSNFDDCWLRSWWDDLGVDLLNIPDPITTLPIPVRPSDDWDDDGGTVVRDGGGR